MAQYSNPYPQEEPQRPLEHPVAHPAERAVTNVASPAPLGLGIAAIITGILGCFYTGFIIPFNDPSMRIAVGIAALISGVVLMIAGMWEYRKGYLMTATFFTAYGGFLTIVGVAFLPPVSAPMGGGIHLFLGMLYLCWTIFLGVLVLGALRTNAALVITLGLLFCAWFFLMLGSLASDNGVLLRVGGWFAIVTAIIAWAASLASLLSTATGHQAFRIPMGERLAVTE